MYTDVEHSGDFHLGKESKFFLVLLEAFRTGLK